MKSELHETGFSSSAASDGFSQIPAQDLQRLLGLRHHDPHSILGGHVTARGVIVRAYRPGAESVDLIVEGEPKRAMRARPEAGLFEILLEKKREVFPYRLEVHFPGGGVTTVRSSYAFLPTLGELDLYLLAEQKHEHAYERMGAHVREVSGVAG
ncbi:MAG TPA: hypothetical protein VN867_15440, partial [Candidatus Binataceae bacterium]|nr:hypothetical protein [Candidatus Binataceae bacterium]